MQATPKEIYFKQKTIFELEEPKKTIIKLERSSTQKKLVITKLRGNAPNNKITFIPVKVNND